MNNDQSLRTDLETGDPVPLPPVSEEAICHQLGVTEPEGEKVDRDEVRINCWPHPQSQR